MVIGLSSWNRGLLPVGVVDSLGAVQGNGLGVQLDCLGIITLRDFTVASSLEFFGFLLVFVGNLYAVSTVSVILPFGKVVLTAERNTGISTLIYRFCFLGPSRPTYVEQ